MRLHELTVTAFGPFAETVTVDFDELGATGLFLLTGPTGAGKSSVLDAVCFGLYGDVPGDRAGARQLRSDHAGPDAEPRVRLRFSVGERSFRLSRSPAWDRPKRRGAGTRRIQASVVAEELRDGRWEALSTRLDETGQLVGELLGMTLTQFTQVALLPQGRFQTFLRASSTERHAVLQRLFRTRRFDDVEHWLAEQRRSTGREAGAALERCAQVLERLCEAAAVELPDAWIAEPGATPATALATAVGAGLFDDWCRELREGLHAAVTERRTTEVAAREELEATRERWEQERRTTTARTRGLAAQRLRDELDAEEPAVTSARSRLRRDAEARPVRALARDEQEHAARLRTVSARVEELRAALPGAPTGPTALGEWRDDISRRQAVVQGWLSREVELDDVRVRHTDAARVAAGSAERAVALEHRVRETTAQVQVLASRQAELRPAAVEVETLVVSLERATAGAHASQQTALTSEELREAVDRQQVLAQVALRLRAEHLDARERRISGAAAELAAGLAVGCSCPVCGSVDHPAPAARAAGAGRAGEDAARAAFESAETERLAADEFVAGVRARLASWQARCTGLDADGWSRAVAEAESDLEAARGAATELADLDAELTRQRAVAAEVAADLSAVRARATAERREARDLERRRDRLEAELVDLVAASGGPDEGTDEVPDDGTGPGAVERLARRLTARHAAVTALLRGAEQQAQARRDHHRAAATAQAAVQEAGFDDVDACLAAVLADDLRTRLQEQVATWEQRTAEVAHVLDEPEVARALQAPAPDPETTARLLRAQELEHRRLVGVLRTAEQRATRVDALAVDLRALLDDWTPRRDRHDSGAALAGLVEGTSADNRLRMRLTGYVLAERLRQVVAAANQRLAAMTEERFALEHAEEKGAGEQRGGLSLRVRDDWSGTRRDPATLSGGESFVVSLALALGLADTVAQEAGGTTIETLFVDEGFGALDTDTLDAVLDVLDGLRDGGRVVGLVSHVAELRARVPSQLEVRKGRHGSTLGVGVAAH